MKKLLQPLRSNVLLRAAEKKAAIILQTKGNNAPPKAQLEALTVHRVGKDVHDVKVGDEVMISLSTLNRPEVYVDLIDEKEDGVHYFLVREDDIEGIYLSTGKNKDTKVS